MSAWATRGRIFLIAIFVLMSLTYLAAHLGCALALCFTPGIGAFLRSQRAPATLSLAPVEGE